ncbi:ferredoxin [Neobacillus niacini]|uniref:4Fe-4S dicluster domain-containing protein n=1 Tax=Neobacillus niacini TaxID=86668 RepID=UPI002864A28C|nr:4Fe-4S dicluster domain-containing protein [Neobacillus niacini]MDR7077002.1 ferredoxin [Neobacillus niacini]
MNLFNWVNVIDQKVMTLKIEPNLCTHMISPKSTCQSCVKNCPTKSISFSKKQIEIDDNCLECGLCSTVCPTNALALNRPPLKQVISELVHQCEQNEKVYLHCEKMPVSDRDVTSLTVPCLGMIPREAWVTVMSKCQNLTIYHSDTGCSDCEIITGERVWKEELHAGETMAGSSMNITSNITHSAKQKPFDKDRRAFISSFFNEIKATNKLAVKELLGNSEVLSYQERRQENTLSKVKRELEEVSHHLYEKMTNESALPYMNKRAFLLAQLKENETLQKQKDIRLPTITADCNFCGACTILCPTDALKMQTENNSQSITLQPAKCLDCSLCEDICYSKSIQLHQVQNSTLLKQEQRLISHC